MTTIENELFSFGALLKDFRKRRHLTQWQLAEAVGVHRNAIGRWEQGDVLPQSKSIVLELIRHLHLDNQESRQLLEASLTALAPHWLVPLSRNPFFTGREEILAALHTQLSSEQAVALTQSSALHGLGGVGKTQIALEYAYRYALEYGAVFWIGAETDESIVSSLLHIAAVLQLPERDDRDQQRVLTAVQQWLTTQNRWLLIWDNVEDLALLDRFLPSRRQGAILITTRCRALGTLAHGIDLLPMKYEEGVLFLLRRAKVLEPGISHELERQLVESKPGDYTTASELVKLMDGLPLALDQAGAYLEETQCGLPAFLDLFRSQRAVLLQQRGERPRDHPAPVSATFTLAIKATVKRCPAVWDLLQVCAFLQPDAIPEELFREGGKQLGAALAEICHDTLEWNQVVAVACTYSLLRRQPGDQTLSLHRLVQAVLLDIMMETERAQWLQRTINALDAIFPDVLPTTEHATWKLCERLLPHAMLCASMSVELSLPLASLALKMAQYLRERGRYAEAEPFFQRALHIREQLQGPDHPEVARVLNYFAILCWSQSRYAEAEPLYQRTLRIREHTLGPDHPDVAASLNNLALLYWSQGKYAEAEPLYQRALRIRERVQGSNHPDVATSLNNLAALYWDQGKYAEAEPLYQRALRILEQSLGPEHSLLAQALSNLALLYRDQGKYTEAEPLQQRALRILEQSLGPDHPDVAQALNNLANLYRDQSRDTDAETLYRRAWQISEQSQGAEHPQAALSLAGLANLSCKQGNYAEARRLFQQALHIQEQHLGQQHPETAQTLHDLTIFHQQQGQLEEALTVCKRALEIREQALGAAHPKTLATRTLYDQLRAKQEQTVSEQHEIPGPPERPVAQTPPSSHEDGTRSLAEHDLLQEFIAACCELHPRASCRSSDLWQAYVSWTEASHERFPLSRGTFIIQLKTHGCRPDRTKTTRIWRGIALANKR